MQVASAWQIHLGSCSALTSDWTTFPSDCKTPTFSRLTKDSVHSVGGGSKSAELGCGVDSFIHILKKSQNMGERIRSTAQLGTFRNHPARPASYDQNLQGIYTVGLAILWQFFATNSGKTHHFAGYAEKHRGWRGRDGGGKGGLLVPSQLVLMNAQVQFIGCPPAY